jgi:hypothetical protein
MAQTFDIRFARSAGFAAILQAPTNSFRWTGAGSLSIDAQGISVGARRGLLSLLARNRTRRISASNLKEVFREGDALRVEFATAESPRASLLFWAHDRDTAAKIVQLLPTTRTVELEENSVSRGFRLNWRMITLLAIVVAAMALGLAALRTKLGIVVEAPETAAAQTSAIAEPAKKSTDVPAASLPAMPDSTPSEAPTVFPQPEQQRPREIVIPIAPGAPDLDSPSTEASGREPILTNESGAVTQPLATPFAIADDIPLPPIVFRVRISSDGVVPIVPGMAAYEKARRQLDLFLAESESPADAAWWAITVRIANDPDFKDPALWPLREMELAVSRAWRDPNLSSANEQIRRNALEFAQLLLNRARQYVD